MCNKKIFNITCLIKETVSLNHDTFSMTLECNENTFEVGQFMMLEVPGFSLRRPFVIVDAGKKNIQIIVKAGEVKTLDYWLKTDLGNLTNGS